MRTSKALGRRDDLGSLLYVLAEFLDGDLPWRSMTDKEQVRASKEAFNRNPQTMMRNVPLPEELKEVMMYLRSLDFEDAPDYTFVGNQLQAVCDRLSIRVR
jgi:tau tubulin kinase